MDHEYKTIIGVLVFLACLAIIVISLESGRKADLLLSQMKEMRQSMEDAGYVQKEQKITEDRK